MGGRGLVAAAQKSPFDPVLRLQKLYLWSWELGKCKGGERAREREQAGKTEVHPRELTVNLIITVAFFYNRPAHYITHRCFFSLFLKTKNKKQIFSAIQRLCSG